MGDLLLEWATIVSGEDRKILETEASAPDRVEFAVVVLVLQLIVDVVSLVFIVACTTWEKDTVQL